MKKVVIWTVLLLLLGGLGAYYYFPQYFVDVPLESTTSPLQTTTLPNGLTVTVKETHALPLVTIQFWVHVGSKDEPDQYRGISHIFEHIWFKGTPTQPVGSFHKRVESLGGELNAMTSLDWTMYYVTLPSDKFDDIFPNMVDLLRNPLFDEEEINKELQVIVEEQRFSYNEPIKYVDDQWAKLLIKEHPYRHPIIGYKDTILGTTRDAVMNFYNTWYVPNNMNIVVVGDVEEETILADVKDAFGDPQRKPGPRKTHPPQKPHTKPQYNSSTRHLGYSYIAAGFTAPAGDDSDRYVMDVITTLLVGGDNSRLQRILKQEKNLAARVVGGYTPLNQMGAVEFIIVTDKATKAKQELILLLNKLKYEKVSKEELERAKALLQADRVKAQEEIFEVGFAIGKEWILGQQDAYSEYITRIEGVTADDIQRVANKYFTAYTMYELKPKL